MLNHGAAVECPLCGAKLASYWIGMDMRLAEHVLAAHCTHPGACFCGHETHFVTDFMRHLRKHGGVLAHWLEHTLGVQHDG